MADAIEQLNAALEGRYNIERDLGTGGMATVYLAEDLKHDRKVAIKVLKPELAAVLGAERFVQEIKTTAQLQHPHILPLHDSGTADGFLFYVMPYIEGETLRDKLDRETQLGIDEAVRITREVADALDYAHRQGIIHRDIKPENILLHDGRPMVADFGIALAVSAAAGGRMTETGTSVGTPHYMSPEQATADKEITGRADQYSLASVLYEMLTGEPPHTGATAQAVIMKIIAEPVQPVTELRKSVPPNVAAAVMKALEKLPADRFVSAHEFTEALRNPAFRLTSTGAVGALAARGAGPVPGWVGWAGWAVAAVVAVVGLWPATDRATAGGGDSYVVHVDTLGGRFGELVFGGDGSLVYDVGREIRIRRPGSIAPTVLHQADQSVAALVSSPDGQSIAFGTFGGTRETLSRMSIDGGPVRTLYEGLIESAGLVWGADGWIYFVRSDGLLVRIREDGSTIDTVGPARGARPLDRLPDGSLLVSQSTGIAMLDPESGEIQPILETPARPTARWSPTGHLVFADRRGDLYAVAFDPAGRRVTGEPVPIQSGVASGSPRLALSPQGALAYIAGAPGLGRSGRSEYRWVGMDGSSERIPVEPVDGHSDGGLSPDFTRLAYIRGQQVHVFDLDLGSDRAVGPGSHDPVWSPDGREIAVRDDRANALTAVAADGSGSRTLADQAATSPSQWLPDGTIIAATFGGDLYAVQDTPGVAPRVILGASWEEHSPKLAPDGRWLAYTSDEDGVVRAWLRAWPALGGRTLVSGSDTVATIPPALHWSADARTLYYVRADQNVMAVPIGTDGRATAGPRVLFNLSGGIALQLDHSRQRFLVRYSAVGASNPDGLPEPNRILLVTDWRAELLRRMGIGR